MVAPAAAVAGTVAVYVALRRRVGAASASGACMNSSATLPMKAAAVRTVTALRRFAAAHNTCDIFRPPDANSVLARAPALAPAPDIMKVAEGNSARPWRVARTRLIRGRTVIPVSDVDTAHRGADTDRDRNERVVGAVRGGRSRLAPQDV